MSEALDRKLDLATRATMNGLSLTLQMMAWREVLQLAYIEDDEKVFDRASQMLDSLDSRFNSRG
jgi:hypothetical protein